MNERMRAILESKRLERGRLAALPFSGKIPLLEQLRDRALAIENSSLYRARGSRAGKAWVLRETGPSCRPDTGTPQTDASSLKERERK